ncbi:MAG: 4-hydroxy-3-methylbut-2-enyl diphosphate reductase, partial [Atopobiaceae bacterium]|nr:4-hydroxy-3-methylbut-2-enyl diphosphate reductase [Atopobiaceae bacterium]
MPEIRLAKESGACFGVERALKLVEDALDRPNAGVYTLGSLIHNPQVLESLEERGVRTVEDADSQPEGTVIVLRAHGVTPQLEQRAKERGLEIVNATCPYVTKTHRDVERLASEGYQIIVVGEAGHAEVVATMAHAEGSLCVGSAEDVRDLAAKGILMRKVGVVVQTTQTKKLLEQVAAELVTKVSELRVINTICDATEDRQSAACELACEADCMIVIGGRISANTTHLKELCAELCANTHHIEIPDELESAWFDGCALIGVTAG